MAPLTADGRSNSRARWGFAVPQVFEGRKIDTALIRSVVEAVDDDAAFDSLWVGQQILGRPRSLDPLGLATYAVAHSERVHVGTAVLLTALHQPALLAKQLATIDQLSHGRLIAGIGLGSRSEFEALGQDPNARIAMFEESIRFMQRLWRGVTTFTGTYWQATPGNVQAKPFQLPHPPLWFGGASDGALERAVRLGDGWIGAGAHGPDQFRREAARVRQSLVSAGRSPASFTIAKRVYIAVEKQEGRAEQQLGRWFDIVYGPRAGASHAAIVGNPETCAMGLRELRDAGADLIILNPVYGERSQLDLLRTHVLPMV